MANRSPTTGWGRIVGTPAVLFSTPVLRSWIDATTNHSHSSEQGVIDDSNWTLHPTFVGLEEAGALSKTPVGRTSTLLRQVQREPGALILRILIRTEVGRGHRRIGGDDYQEKLTALREPLSNGIVHGQ